MRHVFAAAVLLASLTGCGGTSSSNSKPAPECIELTQTALTAVNDGAIGTAKAISGQAVDLPGDPAMPMFTYIAAVNVKDGDSTEQAFLTLDDTDQPNGIFAADNLARVYFEWGAAATKGSTAYNEAESAWMSESAEQAKDCLQ